MSDTPDMAETLLSNAQIAKTYTRIHEGGSSSVDVYQHDDGSYGVSKYGSGNTARVVWKDEKGTPVLEGTSLWHRLESEYLLETEKKGQIKSPQNDDISVPGDPSRGILGTKESRKLANMTQKYVDLHRIGQAVDEEEAEKELDKPTWYPGMGGRFA